MCAFAAIAGCGANGPVVTRSSPSHAASPSLSPSPTPTPTPTPASSPSPLPSPVAVPAWAAIHASCSGSPAANEGLLVMQGSSNPVLADVADAKNPRTLCSLTVTGNTAQPQLVTQSMISWSATQGNPSTAGTSVIAALDMFSGTSTIAASWQGGSSLDGLHAWSPDRGFLAYVASDSSGVSLHLLSGGGDRVVATMGAVPGRGVNPNEDDSYLAFSPDGGYFALVQTFTSSGDQLQVRRTTDGSSVFSLPKGTMASWGSIGSRLFYRQPGSTMVQSWDSSAGVSQAFGQQLAWIKPRAAAGDDNLAFTVRDSAGQPHVWLYGHGGRSGGQLPGARSSPVWINSTSFLYLEEAACTTNCGIGPAWQPDLKTFTVDTGLQSETASRIAQVYGAWPRPGQI